MTEGFPSTMYVTASANGTKVSVSITTANTSYLPGSLAGLSGYPTFPTFTWRTYNDFSSFSFTGTEYTFSVAGVGSVTMTGGIKVYKQSVGWINASSVVAGDDILCWNFGGQTYQNVDSVSATSRTSVTRYSPVGTGGSTDFLLHPQSQAYRGVLVRHP